MAIAGIEEHRVGQLLVRTRAVEHDYRDAAIPAEVEILRHALPSLTVRRVRSAAQVAMVISLLLGIALIVFAAIVRSMPAIGSVSVAVIALAILFGRGLFPRSERGVAVRVAGDELRVLADGTRVRIDRVEDLRTGEDGDLRTLFAVVRERGRVLLLDGLSPDEAALAERHLRAILERRSS